MKFAEGQLDTEWLNQLGALKGKPNVLSELTEDQIENLLVLLECEQWSRYLDSVDKKTVYTDNIVELFK